MRIFVCCMSSFLVAHFLLMGSYAAAASSALSMSRWALSIFATIRKRAWFFVPFYIVVFLVVGSYTYRSWVDALPIIASISGTYALFCCEKLRLRVVLMFGGLFWLAHNLLAHSYGPFVMEAFIFVSNLMMVYRFVADNKKLPSDPEDNFLTRFSGGVEEENAVSAPEPAIKAD